MNELLSPAVNFTILVGGLVYFLRKPVREFIVSRRQTLQKEVEEAQKRKKEAEKRLIEFEKKLKEFENEAQTLLDRARADGETIKARIIDNAKQSAERMLKDAEETISAKIDECRAQIRQETIARAIEIAEKTIEDRLSTEDHRRIIHEYVGKVQIQ